MSLASACELSSFFLFCRAHVCLIKKGILLVLTLFFLSTTSESGTKRENFEKINVSTVFIGHWISPA